MAGTEDDNGDRSSVNELTRATEEELARARERLERLKTSIKVTRAQRVVEENAQKAVSRAVDISPVTPARPTDGGRPAPAVIQGPQPPRPAPSPGSPDSKPITNPSALPARMVAFFSVCKVHIFKRDQGRSFYTWWAQESRTEEEIFFIISHLRGCHFRYRDLSYEITSCDLESLFSGSSSVIPTVKARPVGSSAASQDIDFYEVIQGIKTSS